jgi:voltage-gated potassium channel
MSFDLATIGFLIATSFFKLDWQLQTIAWVIGVFITFEVAARLWISRDLRRDVFSIWGAIDLLVVISIFAPIWGAGLAFLRVLRVFRILQSKETLDQLRQDFPLFRRNESAVRAAINLAIFIFVMTALVYETQHLRNEKIVNYVDALYFTVTTLTTTGFGDITLVGVGGKLLSVVIMIFGISLFLRLVQVMFRPNKADFSCPSCGLLRHDHDAVHCKACGIVLNIPDDGAD